MTPTQASSPSHSSRKATHTYSLTSHGDSFKLMSLASESGTPCAINIQPSVESSILPSEANEIHDGPSYPLAASSSLYVPYIPVARGPRSTNLYLYPPTEADYARARRRSIAKRQAMEEARNEREDDERRRKIILGIAGPRKSARRTKTKPTLADDESEGPVATTVNLPDAAEWRGRKECRSTAKSTKIAIKPQPVPDDAPSSTVSPSISLQSLPLSSEAPSFSKKPRMKPRPKSNPRPTRRLTTRSLTKTKTTSFCATASVSPPGISDSEIMDVGVHQDDSRSERSGSKPPSTHEDMTDVVTFARFGSPKPRSCDSDNRTTSSGDLPSSDTLCNDAPKELAATNLLPNPYSKDVRPDITPSSSRTSFSSIGRSISPSSSAVASLPTSAPTVKQNRNKRAFEDVDIDMNTPFQQNRRSNRVPKKRILL